MIFGPPTLAMCKRWENPEIHEKTTGPEIWNDTDGQVDVFVAGVGTGGTITGTSRFLKAQGKEVISVAVEPVDSPVIAQAKAGQPIQPGPHKIQGIGAGFIPGNLDLDMVDEVEQVGNDEAIEMVEVFLNTPFMDFVLHIRF